VHAGVQVVNVYAVQHAMLVGLTLPWHTIAFSSEAWGLCDAYAAALYMAGLAIAAHADNTLHTFVQHRGKRKGSILRSGLWRYSRHPNHLGEQLWWWGAWLFAASAGGAWTLVGTLFNSACMLQVSTAAVSCSLIDAGSLSTQPRLGHGWRAAACGRLHASGSPLGAMVHARSLHPSELRLRCASSYAVIRSAVHDFVSVHCR
jgi:Protein of unknown function (DUF1295)